MYSISKTYRFSASHQLNKHDGQCRNLHGHNYKVQVMLAAPTIESDPDHPKYGMVLDFADMNAIVRPLIDKLDHTHLNESAWTLFENGETVPFSVYPTAENIAHVLVHCTRKHLRHALGALATVGWFLTVRVHETDDSYAEFGEAV